MTRWLWTAPGAQSTGASSSWLVRTADWLFAEMGWLAALVVCGAYLCSVVPLSSLPMQDYPNHMARAAVISDLLFHHGAHFGSAFQLHFAIVPYVLPDAILTGAVALFGPAVAGALYTGLVMLSLPCALLFYMHTVDAPAPRARPWVFLVSLYLSTDWFFAMGFMAFRLAIALIVVALALAERLRRQWSSRAFAAYLLVAAIGYLTHVAAVAFLVVALAAAAVVRIVLRKTTLRRELALILPPAALFVAAWYLRGAEHIMSSLPALDDEHWKAFKHNVRNLPYEFTGFDWHPVIPLVLLLAVSLLWPVRRSLRWHALTAPAVLEQLGVAAAFLLLYFAVLPVATQVEPYVNVRVLPLVSLALLFACLRLPASERAGLALAALLAVTNLVYLAIHLRAANEWNERYRSVVAAIPSGAYVLPMQARPRQQRVLFASAFVVLDRSAIMPYLFSSDEADPMRYFSYRHRPYAPGPQWYREDVLAHRPLTLDWQRVACDYDYLLPTLPFNVRVIGVPTTRVAGNDTVELLKVDKSACHAVRSHEAESGLDRDQDEVLLASR